MPAPAHRSLPTTAAWALVLAVGVTSAVAGRLCFLGRPFASDGAMFIYMGKLVTDGGRVGLDLIDNKFPTVGLMTSAAWRAFGTTWPAYVLLGTALSAVAAAAVGAAAGRAGRWPAALFAVVFLNLTPAVYAGFQLETPIACFASLAALAAVRAIDDDSAGAALVAGMAAGCAALLKPTAIGVIGAMGLGVIAKRVVSCGKTDRSRAAWPLGMGLATVAGLAVPLCVAAVYLWATDLWATLPATAHRLAAYADGSVFDAGAWLKLATVAVILGFPFAVRCVPFGTDPATARPASEVRRRPGSNIETSGSSAYLRTGVDGRPLGQESHLGRRAFAASWLAIELLGILAQRRMYAYHFLPLVPPAAVLFGLIRRPVRPWPLLAALGPAAALSFCYALHVIATPGENRLPVGRYLQARAATGDRVWTDDWPRLILETGLRPASRQALTFLFANDDATAGADSAQIVADLARRRPAFVVLPADLPAWLHRQTTDIVELAQHPARAAAYTVGWRRIERYTLGHYRREAVVGDLAVYRRADPVVTADAR